MHDKKHQNLTLILIRYLDSLIALFIVFVATCFYWRGSWDIITVYVLPDNEPLNHWVRYGIGICTCFTYFLLPHIKKALEHKSEICFVIASRCFMIFHGTLYMFHWRGLWGVAEYYQGTDPLWGWITLAVTYTLLVMLGCSRHILWPPFVVPIDRRESLLVACNRFGASVSIGVL